MAEIERRALAMPGTPFEGTLEEHREIRRAVRELKDLMSEYRVDMDASAWRSWMAGLSRKLLALHDRLCSHFLEEERSGLYEALTERLPHIARRTQVVREEHETILDKLAAIVASAALLERTWPPEQEVLERVREVLYRIVRHEQKESDLIARACIEDLESLN